MAISHRDCDHESTPKARAKCRSMREAQDAGVANAARPMKPAKIKSIELIGGGRKAGKGPMRGATNIKKPGTVLRTIGDLPDVPRMLAYGARLAWANDWPVVVGHPFNDNEARLVINAPAGEIALVWRPSLPDGVWGVFFRAGYNSVTTKHDSVQEAFELGALTTD